MAGGEDDPDFHSYSLRPYEQEFLEHPDLVATWAVDEAFLARFAEGFEAYRYGAHVLQCALQLCSMGAEPALRKPTFVACRAMTALCTLLSQ